MLGVIYIINMLLINIFSPLFLGRMTNQDCVSRAIKLLVSIRNRVMNTPFKKPQFQNHEEYRNHIFREFGVDSENEYEENDDSDNEEKVQPRKMQRI